jgi:hypothetical protein
MQGAGIMPVQQAPNANANQLPAGATVMLSFLSPKKSVSGDKPKTFNNCAQK